MALAKAKGLEQEGQDKKRKERPLRRGSTESLSSSTRSTDLSVAAEPTKAAPVALPSPSPIRTPDPKHMKRQHELEDEAQAVPTSLPRNLNAEFEHAAGLTCTLSSLNSPRLIPHAGRPS